MGHLFASGAKSSVSAKTRPSDSLMRQLECRACSLNRVTDLHHPKMVATGSREPLIYILGEAPDGVDDREGYQFAGAAGDFLRPYLPGSLRSRIRWNNTIRCNPGISDSGAPLFADKVQLACCRPGLERDIEEHRPDAIFGFGVAPLAWTDRPSGIDLWRGRRFPVRVGRHTCWYYAMQHPSYIIEGKRKSGRDWGTSDAEVAFGHDMRRAVAEVQAGLPPAVVHDAKFARADITCVNGRAEGDLSYVLDFLEHAGEQDVAGVDYEATHLRPYFPDFLLLTAAVSVPDETVSFAWRHREAGWSPSSFERLEAGWLRFLKSRALKAVHNLSYEMEVTCFLYGAEYARSVPWGDTLTQAFVCDERIGEHKPGALSLEFICLQHFGINVKELTRGLNKARMGSEPLSSILPYNGSDAKYHRLVYAAQDRAIDEGGLRAQYEEKLEQVPTVVLSQLKGMPVSREVNEELSAEYGRRLAEAIVACAAQPAAQKFRRLTGRNFDPFSAQIDVPLMLREVLGVQAVNTRKDVLEGLEDPVGKSIIAVRQMNKLKSTYVDPYAASSPIVYDGTLHASFGTCFTETGRLQCVAGDTVLSTSMGDLVISELDLQIKHKGIQIRTHAGSWRDVRALIRKPPQEMWRLQFSDGSHVDCTERHRLLTPGGWKYVDAFKLGDTACGDPCVQGYLGVPNLRYSGTNQYCRFDGRDYPIVRLVSREPLRIQTVWDISVEGDQSYVSQGLIHHNCEDPNLQNLPTRAADAKRVRRQIQRPGGVFVKFDYGQIDARIIACGSRDRAYCKALWEDYDIHLEWARRLARHNPEWVGGREYVDDPKKLGDFRGKRVKNDWVFALFYTASLKTTAGRFDVSDDFMRPMYDEFWRQFAGVKKWQETLIKQFEELGYVQLLGGLRRHAPLGRGQIVNCVDLETECLTEHGWKRVDEINKKTKIYTKNPTTGAIELQACFGITRAFYRGKVCVMNGSISAVTTPNHRWLIDRVYRGCEKKVGFITSEDFVSYGGSSQRIHLTGGGVETPGGVWTDDEIRLVGWLVTDGWYIANTRKSNDYWSIGVGQSPTANPEKVELIDDLFFRLFGHGQYVEDAKPSRRFWYKRYYYGKGQVKWRVYNSLVDKIKAILPDKVITPLFLSELSQEQLRILFETMLLGDGCWDESIGRYRTFISGSKTGADMFSMLCVLIGQSHSVRYRDMSKYSVGKVWPSMNNSPNMTGVWVVSLKQRKYAHPQGQVSWDDNFAGEVWCPQVPNQTFIARREGKVYVTGNTPVQGGTNRVVMDAMNRLSKMGDPVFQPNLQLHDDLSFIFESEREFEDCVEPILDCMLDGRAFPWICVPLSVEIEAGPSWADVSKVGTYSSHKRLGWPLRPREFT